MTNSWENLLKQFEVQTSNESKIKTMEDFVNLFKEEFKDASLEEKEFISSILNYTIRYEPNKKADS